MKTTFSLLFVIFLATAMHLQAQDVSNVLTQVSEGIKPEAFTKKFLKNKEAWMDQVASTASSNLPTVTKQVGSLVKGLKGSALEKGVKKELVKQLGSISNLSDVSGILNALVNGLNPAMLTEAFASNKDNLIKGLELLN